MKRAARSADRRQADRRRSESPSLPAQSWFGELGPGDQPADSTDESDPGPDTDTIALAQSFEASRLEEAAPRRSELPEPTAFERIYRTFIGARAVLGVTLALALVAAAVFGLRPAFAVTLLSLGYAAQALSLWLLPRLRRPAPGHSASRLRKPQWLATIGIDVVCFVALHLLAPGSSLNFVALLVLPVLMAGVLTTRLAALTTTAAITLALLVAAWLGIVAGGDATQLMTQTGLAGGGFFVIAVLAGELAERLAREENAARGSLEIARQQTRLNRLVIEEMQDGVLVVDRRGRVRAANPAARRLLAARGMSRRAPFQLRGVPAWRALVDTVERAFREATWPEAGRDVVLEFEPAVSRTLRVRIRFTQERQPDPQSSEEFCVLFLEDVRNMQARIRQEKLAAMGRVSAGIAHEIRNPLAAISQANALLAEDAVDPAQQRLMRMVSDNVERLKRIVDDVVEVAPGPAPDPVVIDVTAVVGAACGEWAQAHAILLGEHSVLRVDLPAEPIGVLFDAEHLRRVLVNLLDNARRHASTQPGAIHVRLDSRDTQRAFLSIASDGPPIPADVERYLFEPFFSTRSRGTGLGLYICRELCERYGASVDYRLRPGGEVEHNEFFVAMRRMAFAPAEATLRLMT
ncbi:MAG: ATP-binding protein [Burkholderiaceae bacterium]